MSAPTLFRLRSREIEVMQWSGHAEDAHPIIQWINGVEGWTAVWREYRPYSSGGLFPQEAQDRIDEGIYIKVPGSWREFYVGPGDYVKLLDGVFQVQKQDVFEADWEPSPT